MTSFIVISVPSEFVEGLINLEVLKLPRTKLHTLACCLPSGSACGLNLVFKICRAAIQVMLMYNHSLIHLILRIKHMTQPLAVTTLFKVDHLLIVRAGAPIPFSQHFLFIVLCKSRRYRTDLICGLQKCSICAVLSVPLGVHGLMLITPERFVCIRWLNASLGLVLLGIPSRRSSIFDECPPRIVYHNILG